MMENVNALARLIADPNFRAIRVIEEYRNYSIADSTAVCLPTDKPFDGLVVLEPDNSILSDGFSTVENCKCFIDRWLDEGFSKIGQKNEVIL